MLMDEQRFVTDESSVALKRAFKLDNLVMPCLYP